MGARTRHWAAYTRAKSNGPRDRTVFTRRAKPPMSIRVRYGHGKNKLTPFQTWTRVGKWVQRTEKY